MRSRSRARPGVRRATRRSGRPAPPARSPCAPTAPECDVGAYGPRGRAARGRLFENHVTIRSTKPEGAHACEAACAVARPRMRLLDRNEERGAGNRDSRVELLEVE